MNALNIWSFIHLKRCEQRQLVINILNPAMNDGATENKSVLPPLAGLLLTVGKPAPIRDALNQTKNSNLRPIAALQELRLTGRTKNLEQ